MSHNLSQPERFTITGPQGETYRGGNQEWYRDLWQQPGRAAAPPLPPPCWPTSPRPTPAWPPWPRQQGHTQAGFLLQYMEAPLALCHPPAPGAGQAGEPGGWAAGPSPCPGGVLQGGDPQDPPPAGEPPQPRRLPGFSLIQSLDANCPVAFLNFSNGSLPNLDSWHWVPSSPSPRGEGVLLCTILDEGAEKVIDLALWQETTLLGGALVTLFPDPAL